MKIYKLIFFIILIYFLLNIIKETFQQDFTLPKIKLSQIENERKEKQKLKNQDKFNIQKTLKTGQGVNDRIRYNGKWN